MNKRIPVVDLFAGCGGLSLGFRQAGYDIRLAVESDQSAAATFRRNFSDATLIESQVENLTPSSIRELALRPDDEFLTVIGGPPCQGFSTLRWGRKKDEDPRNALIYVFAEFIRQLQPHAWLLENVPTIRNHEAFLRALELFAQDYSVHGPVTLDASDFGVPQFRRRLFVVGVRDGVSFSFPRPNYLDGNKRSVEDAIGDLPSPEQWKRGDDATKGSYANHQSSRHSEAARRRLESLKPGQSHLDLPEELVLECHQRAADVYGRKVYRNVYGRMDTSLPAPTITGGCINVTRGRFGHPVEPRAITPREAARLQTFPDYFVFEGGRESVARQIGNAVPVRLAKRLAFGFKFGEARESRLEIEP